MGKACHTSAWIPVASGHILRQETYVGPPRHIEGPVVKTLGRGVTYVLKWVYAGDGLLVAHQMLALMALWIVT